MINAPQEMRLAVNGITVRFGATLALNGVDLAVKAGEIHALLGENGAGKSTLMKVLSGALKPSAGTMAIDGKPYKPSNPLEGRRAGVAMIYQELSIVQHLTVAENICLGVEPSNGPFLIRGMMRERARAALGKLQHLNLDLDACAKDLSVSHQQIVEIARSLAVGCRVLILDEPSSSLTRQDVSVLFALLKQLKQQNYAIIYISHFLEEVREIADKYTVIRDGKNVFTGDPGGTTVEEMIALMMGGKPQELYSRSPRLPGPPVLEARNLVPSRLSPGARVSSMAFTLYRGEVVGIAGLVGSGRTEMVRCLFGLDAIHDGSLEVLGIAGWKPPALRWRQGVGMLSEDRQGEGLALSMDIVENIVLPCSGNRSSQSKLYVPHRQESMVRELIGNLAIKCSGPFARVRTLSGGNQQKVALARLLHSQADILILDEPTRGIDVHTKSQLYAQINALANQGKTILIVSSYLPELLGICDRIAVMRRGKLSSLRPANQLSEQELLLLTVSSEGEEDDDTAQ